MSDQIIFPASTTLPRRTGQSCSSHATKRGDLYCLSCELVICSECLVGSRGEHYRHPIETVKQVYEKRFQKTRSKLNSLNEHIISMRENVEERFSELENIRKSEASVMQRLDRILVDARLQVTEKSRKLAKQLEPLFLTTQLKAHNRDQLLAKIVGLSEGEFLAQQVEIDKQIDGMARSINKAPDSQEGSEIITCSLLPMISTCIRELNIEEHRSISFFCIDRYGIRWDLQLKQADKLMLLIETSKLEALAGNFVFDLEILNKLPLKNIVMKIPFKLPESSSLLTAKVLTTNLAELKNDGFFEKDNLLRIKCGIGPEDPASERSCHELIVSKYKNKIRSLREELLELRKFAISHCFMAHAPYRSDKCVTQRSPKINDENGVAWQFEVRINGKRNKGFIGTFLTKCTAGYGGWYEYFIELVNPQSEQNNRIVKGSVLFEDGPNLHLDLPQFMTIAFIDQFLSNGNLHFRFGICKEE